MDRLTILYISIVLNFTLLMFDEYLYCICVLTSCWEDNVIVQLQNWGTLVQSLSQLWEERYISHNYFLWKVFFHLLPKPSHDLRVKPIASCRFHWGLNRTRLAPAAFLSWHNMNQPIPSWTWHRIWGFARVTWQHWRYWKLTVFHEFLVWICLDNSATWNRVL